LLWRYFTSSLFQPLKVNQLLRFVTILAENQRILVDNVNVRIWKLLKRLKSIIVNLFLANSRSLILALALDLLTWACQRKDLRG